MERGRAKRMIIHVQTPNWLVIEATDLGIVKAAITLATLYGKDVFTYELDNRKAIVKKIR